MPEPDVAVTQRGGRTCLYPDCLGRPLTLGAWRVRDLGLLALPGLASLLLLLRTGAQAPLVLCLLCLFLTVRSGSGRTMGGMLFRFVRHLILDRRSFPEPAGVGPEGPGAVLPPLGLLTPEEADARIADFALDLMRNLRSGGEVILSTRSVRPDVSGPKRLLEAVRDDPDAPENRRTLAKDLLLDLDRLCGPVPRCGIRVLQEKGGDRKPEARGKPFMKILRRPAARPGRKGTGTGRAAPGTGQMKTVRTPYTLGWRPLEEADIRPGTPSAGGGGKGETDT